ncbi:MAG: ATP-binding protein [Archaeoglobaceae archaeon]
MIFAFSGPSCSGKTTLVSGIAKILGKAEEVVVIGEVARTVFDEDFSDYGTLDELRKNENAYLKYQLRILEKQVEMEEKAKRKGVKVISDRSIYDCYVYSRLFLPPALFERFLDVFRIYAGRKYDVIFLCHPLPPRKDGFRSSADLRTQHLQLGIIKEVLQTYHPENVVELRKTGHELRIREVLKKITAPPMR